jgi:hypothetical protein
LERRPAPLAAAAPSGAPEMTELSDSWEPPTWPLPQGAGRGANEPSVAMALGSPTASESITTVVRAEVSEDHAPGAVPALDTPMTGASDPGPEPEDLGKRAVGKSALGRMAFALAGAGAVVVLGLSATLARSSREPATSGVQGIDNPSVGGAPAASDSEFGARPPRSITDAVDVARPPADSVVMPTLAAPAEPGAVKTTSAPPEAAPNGLAPRKTTPPPRPALRTSSAKASVPDDGRDELYVPAVTR